MEPSSAPITPVSSLDHSASAVTEPATHTNTATVVTTSNLPSGTSAVCSGPVFFVVVVSNKLEEHEHLLSTADQPT